MKVVYTYEEGIVRFLIFLFLLSIGSVGGALYLLRTGPAQAIVNLGELESYLRPACYLSRFTSKAAADPGKPEPRTLALHEVSLIYGSVSLNLDSALPSPQEQPIAELRCLYRGLGFRIIHRSEPNSPARIEWQAPWRGIPAFAPWGHLSLSSLHLDAVIALPPQNYHLTSSGEVFLEFDTASPSVVKLLVRDGKLNIAPELQHVALNQPSQVLSVETDKKGSLSIGGVAVLGPRETALVLPSGLSQKRKIEDY